MTNTEQLLASVAGEWTGTNKLRMMPDDPYTESPSTANVCPAARSRFVALSYTWQADDAEQDGFLLVGDGVEPGSFVAVWCDSWHQSPQWMECAGSADDAGRVTLSGTYGDPAERAGWRIHLVPGDGRTLQITMDNVIPDADYQVVQASYTRP